MTIYSRESCSPCRQLKTYLDRKGITYEVKDVDQPENLKELLNLTGLATVPVTIIKDQIIPGLNLKRISEAMHDTKTM